jgi:hypothetical protein
MQRGSSGDQYGILIGSGDGGQTCELKSAAHGPLGLERSPSRGLRPLREFPDNGKNPEHDVQIRDAEGRNHDGGDPLGGPGNKQSQRELKRREEGHGNPKPRMPTQLPPQCNGEGDHRCRYDGRTREVKSAEIYKQQGEQQSAEHDAENSPRR